MYKAKIPCFLQENMIKFTVRYYGENSHILPFSYWIFSMKGAAFMYSSAYVWAKILSYLEERLTSTIVSANFDDAEVVELNESHLILYSPSDFRREVISRRYCSMIQDALKDIFNSDAKLIIFGQQELTAYKSKGKSSTPAICRICAPTQTPRSTSNCFATAPAKTSGAVSRPEKWPPPR